MRAVSVASAAVEVVAAVMTVAMTVAVAEATIFVLSHYVANSNSLRLRARDQISPCEIHQDHPHPQLSISSRLVSSPSTTAARPCAAASPVSKPPVQTPPLHNSAER